MSSRHYLVQLRLSDDMVISHYMLRIGAWQKLQCLAIVFDQNVGVVMVTTSCQVGKVVRSGICWLNIGNAGYKACHRAG
jgi:hypothetical protein